MGDHSVLRLPDSSCTLLSRSSSSRDYLGCIYTILPVYQGYGAGFTLYSAGWLSPATQQPALLAQHSGVITTREPKKRAICVKELPLQVVESPQSPLCFAVVAPYNKRASSIQASNAPGGHDCQSHAGAWPDSTLLFYVQVCQNYYSMCALCSQYVAQLQQCGRSSAVHTSVC